MLSYVYLGTNDLQRAIAFYDTTLATLGSRVGQDLRWLGNLRGLRCP